MHETKPQTLFLESCSSNMVVELGSQKKLFCRIFFKRLWKRDKTTATRISRSRLSQMNRVEGNPPFVLASDNLYLYRNLVETKPAPPSPTRTTPPTSAIRTAWFSLLVLPIASCHDALQSQKSPT
jgi:hypothetical protein